MRFYNRQHCHYCGIDLHVRTMYVGILDASGPVLALEQSLEEVASFMLFVSFFQAPNALA